MSTPDRPAKPGRITPQTSRTLEQRDGPAPEAPPLANEVLITDVENGWILVLEAGDEPDAWLKIDDENVFNLEDME